MIEDKNRAGPEGNESDVPRVGLDHAIHKAVHQSLEPTLSFFLKPIEVTVAGVVKLFSTPQAQKPVPKETAQVTAQVTAKETNRTHASKVVASAPRPKRVRSQRVRAHAPQPVVPVAPKDDLIYFKKTTTTHVSAKTSHTHVQAVKNQDSKVIESVIQHQVFHRGVTY